MGTKAAPGAFDCYRNAEPDEPMFVLLGRDKHAAALVNLWAAMRLLDGETQLKIDEAGYCANAMAGWLMDKRSREPAGIRTLAEGMVLLAEQCGVHIEITQRVKPPLAMGNYEARIEVWYARKPA